MALTFRTKLCYSLGHVLNDLCASMWFTYLLAYLHSVLNFTNQWAGNMMLLGQIADAVSTPLVGLESDRTVSGLKGYGRRKTWHLIGTFCVAISFPFIFNPIPLGAGDNAVEWARFIYYAPFIVIFQFGWAATQISHLALIPDLSLDESDRVLLNSTRYFFTVASNLLVYLATYFLLVIPHTGNKPTPPPEVSGMTTPADFYLTDTLDPMGNLTDDNQSLTPKDMVTFRILSFGVVGLGLLFSLVFHLGVQEKRAQCPREVEAIEQKHREEEEQRNRQVNGVPSHQYTEQNASMTPNGIYRVNNRNTVSEIMPSIDSSINNSNEHTSSMALLPPPVHIHVQMTWKDWLQEPQFYLVNMLYMSVRVIVNISQTYMAMYLTDALGLPKMNIALIPFTIYSTSLLTSVLQKGMQYCLGRKINLLIGLIFTAAFCVNVYLTPRGSSHIWQVFISAGLLGVASSGLLVGVLSVTADLIANDNKSSAFVYGAMSFTDKLSNGIVIEAVQFLHPCTRCCVNCRWYFRDIEVFVTGGFAILSLLLLVVLTPMKLGRRWRPRPCCEIKEAGQIPSGVSQRSPTRGNNYGTVTT